MPKVTLIKTKLMNEAISHIKGVKLTVRGEAKQIAGIASGRLAGHTKTGEHRIEVAHGTVDSFVSLTGPAPKSVEFGHAQSGWYEGAPGDVGGLNLFRGYRYKDGD